MKKISFLSLLLVTCFGFVLPAQVNLNGQITDTKLNPLHGVSVRLLNSNRGVVSNQQGVFAINNVSPGNYIIEFSAVGFASKNQRVTIGKQSVNIQISLEQT